MTAKRAWRSLIGSGLGLALAGCGAAGPIDSGSMTIKISSMNGSDIRTAGTIEKDSNISTGTGNPWGEFVKRAEAECGRDPVAFEVTSLSMALDTSGGKVSRLEEVISGTATVVFLSTSGSDASATRAEVGSVSSPTGAGPVALRVTATRATLAPLLPRLVGGDFHVGLRAATSRTGNDSFSMDVLVTLAARAHCE